MSADEKKYFDAFSQKIKTLDSMSLNVCTVGVPDMQKISVDPPHLRSVKIPNEIPTNKFSEFYTSLSRLPNKMYLNK